MEQVENNLSSINPTVQNQSLEELQNKVNNLKAQYRTGMRNNNENQPVVNTSGFYNENANQNVWSSRGGVVNCVKDNQLFKANLREDE